MINDRRQVLYSKECMEGQIFEVGEDVPEGFFDTPTKIKAPVKTVKKTVKKKAKK